MPGLQDDIDDITETSQDVMRYLSARRQGGMGRGRPQQLPTPGRAPSSGHSVVPRLASTNWPPPSLQSPSPSSRHTTLPTTSAVSSPLPAFQQQAFNQDMQSSFAYLRRNVVRSKKRPAALSKLSPAICKKYVRLQFFLVPGPTDRTPNASEEIKLLEAGLGKRTVAEDAGHDEIVSLLEAHYSKLKKLEGAWLYHKATGGQGQRKLNQVTGDDEGYTGSFLKSVTSNGRYILYIVPIQEELDVTPLPHDAQEFSKMPKACCKRCGVVMPLQFLTLHIKSCAVEEISDVPQSIDDEDLAIIEDENEDFAIYEETKTVLHLRKCPICGEPFPKEDIAWHASSCGDGY